MPGAQDGGLQVVDEQAFDSRARAGRSRLVSRPCGRRLKGPDVVKSQGLQGRCDVARGPLIDRVARGVGVLQGFDHLRNVTAGTDNVRRPTKAQTWEPKAWLANLAGQYG